MLRGGVFSEAGKSEAFEQGIIPYERILKYYAGHQIFLPEREMIKYDF